jgi:hypothetical protein
MNWILFTVCKKFATGSAAGETFFIESWLTATIFRSVWGMKEGWMEVPCAEGLICDKMLAAPEIPLNPVALVPSNSLRRSLRYLISYRLLKSLPRRSSICCISMGNMSWQSSKELGGLWDWRLCTCGSYR